MQPNAQVFVVDDDREMNESLRTMLQSIDLTARFFPSAEEFLANYSVDAGDVSPRCLLLDVSLPGLSGLELQAELRRLGYQLPVLVMTGNSTVPLAVQAMQCGAIDFLEKPIRRQTLIAQIDRAIEEDARHRPSIIRRRELRDRLSALTPREQEVLDLMLQGKSNKRLAFELGITVKTASKHSSRVFAKLRNDNLIELSQLIGDGPGPVHATSGDRRDAPASRADVA